MKTISTKTITFNPISKTVDTGIENFDIRRLYAIINQTANQIIYATSSEKGYSNVTGDAITLQYDTSAMSSTDILQIIYDDSEQVELIAMLLELSNRLAFLPSVRGTLADLRVSVINTAAVTVSSGTITTVTTVTTVSTVTTVATLTNQTNIGGFAANQHIPALQNNIAVQSNIQNLTIT
jgi:hypothetical protein